MRSPNNPIKHARAAGFTLVEAAMAMGVLTLFIAACLTAILFNRIACMKVKEEGIAMDFLVHYMEPIKALPFDDILAGKPINPTYDGGGQKVDTLGNRFSFPTICIPPDTSWVNLNTAEFETFCPDLLWLRNLNPQLRVTMETLKDETGAPHEKHLKAKVAWDAPLGHGDRLQLELDVIRTKDVRSESL